MDSNTVVALKNFEGVKFEGQQVSLVLSNGEYNLMTKTSSEFLVDENPYAQFLCREFNGKSIDTPNEAIKNNIKHKMIQGFSLESDRIKDILSKMQAKPYIEMMSAQGKAGPLLAHFDQLRQEVVMSTLQGTLFKNGKSDFIQNTLREYQQLNKLMIEFDNFMDFTENLVRQLSKILSELPEKSPERLNMIKNLDTFSLGMNLKAARQMVGDISSEEINSMSIHDSNFVKEKLSSGKLSLAEIFSVIKKSL